MGAVDPGERELLAGLIKLSAAFVHAARGNAAGVLVNLRGARARLAAEDAAGAALRLGLDTTALPAAIDELLAGLERAPAAPPDRAPGRPPDPPHEVAGPPGRALRPPLALAAPSLDPGLRPGAADAGAGAPGTPGSGPCG